MGFLDSQPNEDSEQESSDTLSLPKLESFVATKESAKQNQTENVTKPPEGMAVIYFVSLFSKTGHHVLLEYGKWQWGKVGNYRKNLEGILELWNFVRLFIMSKYLKKYFEND